MAGTIFEFVVAGVLYLLVLLWPAIGVAHGVSLMELRGREPFPPSVKVLLSIGSLFFIIVGVGAYRDPTNDLGPADSWSRLRFLAMLLIWAAALWLPVWAARKGRTKTAQPADKLYETATRARPAALPLMRGDFGRS